MVSRAQLEALVARLDRESGAPGVADDARKRSQLDADAVRSRLRNGDFLAGDRFFLAISGPVSFADTLTIRDGLIADIKEVGTVSLKGVLRSELQPHVTAEVARYVKNATVRAESFVSVAVMGPVGKPGFYAFPAYVSISDVIMRAGGPSPASNIDKTVIRRGGAQYLSSDIVREALARGATLDQLNLRSGDEIQLGTRSNINWPAIIQSTAALASLTALVVYGFAKRNP
jgi:hypothetical protein